MLADFLSNFFITIRFLWKRPSFPIVVVLTLAIGIGACATIFTVVNSVLLRPLAFGSPEQLVLLPSLNKDAGGKTEEYGGSLIDFLDWRDRARSFTELAAMQPTEVAITGSGVPEQVEAGIISANLFHVLGVRPYAGRFFSVQEEVENSHVVILSHGLWLRRFGGAKDVLARTIVVDGTSRQIIGIAPSDFFFAANAELWVPLNLRVPRNPRTSAYNLAVTGRLRNGIPVEQASKEIKAIAAQLAREYPANSGWDATALPIREPYVREVRDILYFLLAAVSALLLLVCVNVSNVILVRHLERRAEFALRLALGGTRRQLLLQGFLENTLLTTCGGVLGLLLSTVALKPIVALSPLVASSPSGNRILNAAHIDVRVILFVFGICFVISALLSAIPLIRTSGFKLYELLKSASRRSTGALRERRFQAIFVIAQLAVSFLLLIGAALMLQSFLRLKNTDPGFKTESLITARITLPESRYPKHEQRAQFLRAMLAKIKSIPGIDSASTTTRLPLNEFGITTLFEVDGRISPEGGFVANFRRIGDSYFQTLRTSVLEGREFTAAEGENGMPVAIVSREMARRIWPGQSAIGKRIRRMSKSDRNWRTIVGVVKDVKDSSIASDPGLTLYIPYAQASIPSFHLVIRSNVIPDQMMEPLRRTIHEMDPDLPLYQVTTAEELLMDSLSRPRFAAYLLAGFAFLGMLIALIGVYGVVSYSTARRVNEIGVRIAVGAQQSSILALILEQSLRLSLYGILLGLIASLFLENSVTSLWSGHGGWNIYLSTASAIAVTAVTASLLPAFRATRVDPVHALRYE